MGVRVRPKPKYKPRARVGPPPKFVLGAVRWAAAWAAFGVVSGVLVMLVKTLPFMESGARQDSMLSYLFWIPLLGGAAAAAGFGIGLIFSGLMWVTTDWRDSLEGDGLMIRLGPDVLCGAAAGLVPGLLVGGLTGALFFATLGGCTAAALKWWEGRKG
jgi:hypothetical protein